MFITKPIRGTQLNREHPLSRGLVGCWVMNEGTGDKIWDYGKYNQSGTITGATWGKGGIKCDDTEGQYIDLGSTIFLKSGNPFSIIWQEEVIADTDNYPSRFCLYIENEVDYYICFRDKTGEYNGIGFGRCPQNNGAQISDSNIPPSSYINQKVTFAITGIDPSSLTTADFALYLNGVSQALGSPVNTGTVTVNRIGYDGVDNGPNCYYYYFYIYNRILSAAEIAWLHRKSYEMFDKPKTYWVISTPSGLIVPVIYKDVIHSTVLDGAIAR